jgi:hypothetical protein
MTIILPHILIREGAAAAAAPSYAAYFPEISLSEMAFRLQTGLIIDHRDCIIYKMCYK